jgi:hypothetical protein
VNDDEVITAVREQRDKVHSHTPVDQIISRGRTVRARRRIPGAVAGLAVVAGGTALALGLTGVLGAAPARSTGTIRTTAFTLVEHADGTATLTINPDVLLETGILQSDLQHDGIRAMVTTGRFCFSDPGPAGFNQVVTGQRSSPDTMTINPAAMPAGTELSFGYFKLSSGKDTGQETADTLIDTNSYTCTSAAPVAWPGEGKPRVWHGDIVATITTPRSRKLCDAVMLPRLHPAGRPAAVTWQQAAGQAPLLMSRAELCRGWSCGPACAARASQG